MDYETLSTIIDVANERQKGIIYGKGKEYAKDSDALSNFKQNGARVGVAPTTSLSIFFNKHVDSLTSRLKDIQRLWTKIEQMSPAELQKVWTELESGEGVISRIDDATNYLHLLEALLIDIFDPATGKVYPGNQDTGQMKIIKKPTERVDI